MNGPGIVILIVRSVRARRKADVVDLDRPDAPEWPDDARGRIEQAAPLDERAGVFEIDALEGVREAARVALAAHLAVRDDVDAGPLHVTNRQHGRVVLRLLRGTPPAPSTARARARAEAGVPQAARGRSASLAADSCRRRW